ncbi:MAG: patatin-like phospholipase family protein [Betaproteobacteria bacterium]|nr:patatin-like phospholipase family protein [Betaproteobacteria bacterium]MDH3436440.1 patatin-like phospholipase family protein [Betaproteobacteria bacterium]
MNQSTNDAKRILENELPVPRDRELKHLISEIKGELEFGLARKVLTEARAQEPDNTWVIQQLALCTYKDEELLAGTRFADALAMLKEIGLSDPEEAIRKKGMKPETLPETLALGGAVYKRMWEHGGQLEHLHQALFFYRAAWECDTTQDKEIDKGYGGVNAAYLFDLLAARATTIAVRAGTKREDAAEANELRQKARALREAMAAIVPKLSEKDTSLNSQYWYIVTLAEIYFGLGQYEEAGKWLTAAREAKPKEWEQQTAFKQLVSLARLQGCKPPAEGSAVEIWHPAWQALHKFLQEDTEAALSCYRGKVGLALSGGGFRASLFHLGVLARLAEMDVLRAVEALSTVSGGSIVGAHYYLEIQEILKKGKDKSIARQDYIKAVRRVQERFLAGVQRNMRMRALASLGANLRMIFSKEYSRSHRLGELYEENLYERIGANAEHRTEPRTMPELLVKPAEQPDSHPFKPKFSNWRRRAKVPVLLLNATSLNSGHSWQFTGRWMGEPPGSIGTEIDVNERYRRLWYEQASKDEHKHYRLGYAVAASACVPGLFEPLVLDELYPQRTVRLVDGGVHDNQGVGTLLDEGCTLMLCSDASGQMGDQKHPSNSIIGVPLRSNSILMDRVREAEYQDLRARVDNRALQGLFFIHTKKGLETLPIDWIDCQDPTKVPEANSDTTDYGVDRDLQLKLAAIRTDLDSFTEVEAYSLMLSGYLMTEYEFKELDKQHKRDGELGTWGGFDIQAPRGDWPFRRLEDLIREPRSSSDVRRADLGRQLDAGSALFFKIWKLSPVLRSLGWVGGVAAAVLLVWFIYAHWDDELTFPEVSVGGLTLFIVLLVAGIVFPLVNWLDPQKAARGYLRKALVAVAGFVVTNIHLSIFDRMFLRRGKLERLLKLK